MAPIKSIAIIGAGPAGTITVDALAQEQEFDSIRVVERREKTGGCWIEDPEDHVQQIPDFEKVAARIPDETLPIPSQLPTTSPHNTQYRFSETSIYPTLETNIDAFAMSFSQESFPEERTPLNVQRHGEHSPFRHWKAVEGYLQWLLNKRGYQNWVSYNTTVELIHKDKESGKWALTLRKPLENGKDRWWTETFDAVVVAAGHYQEAWNIARLGGSQRNILEREQSQVGASVSGPDIAYALAEVAETPLRCVVRGKYHPYFFNIAFQHPNILRRPPITHIVSNRDTDERTVFFENGTKLEKVDHIIFGTGYSWTMHFFPEMAATIRNNRLPNLYQHVFWREDPTLCFVGAIAAGFTFKVFEWQAVLAARFLAGRITLPPVSEQIKWEEDRIAYKGDGVPFTALYPDFEEYFEEVRKMAGEPENGKGRPLPKFEKWWREGFDRAHLSRIAMWKRGNEEARERIRREKQRQDGKKEFVDLVPTSVL